MKKFEVEEIWSWINLKLKKFEAEEIWSWRNFRWKKFEVEEISGWRNFKLKEFEIKVIWSWRNLKLRNHIETFWPFRAIFEVGLGSKILFLSLLIKTDNFHFLIISDSLFLGSFWASLCHFWLFWGEWGWVREVFWSLSIYTDNSHFVRFFFCFLLFLVFSFWGNFEYFCAISGNFVGWFKICFGVFSYNWATFIQFWLLNLT